MPVAFEIYGACSEKFEDFLKKKVTTASDASHVPCSVSLNHWRKRSSLPQHAAKSFSFPTQGDLRTPTGNDGRIPDGLIRGALAMVTSR